MLFTELNTKVLLDIFDCLDLIDAINLAGTCVRLREVAQLQYAIRYRIFNLRNFLNDGDQVQRHNYVDATVVLKSIGHVISVLVVDLDETKIGAVLVATIRRYCTKVKSLKIVSRCYNNKPLTVEWLKSLKLEKITLQATDVMLLDLSGTSTLKELVFCWPWGYSDPNARWMVKRIFERNRNIASMSIKLFDGIDYESFATLNSLKCIQFDNVHEGTLQKVAAQLKMSELEKVGIDRTYTSANEISAFLATLAKNAPKLKELSVHSTERNDLTSIHLFELTSLRITVTDPDACKELPEMQPNLKHLDLFISNRIKPAQQIISLVKGMHRLEIFHVDTFGNKALSMMKALKKELGSDRIWNACSFNRPELRMYVRNSYRIDFVRLTLNFTERKFTVTDIPFRRNYFSESINNQLLLPCCY
ncbi:uncharacterized protein LOC119075888 [Bradysia coprophila]|uniref:uncharacterized protein LOC119075888 n=1 Tax=Bradysia coprophila TaxID=38358 RepID=UPI00187DB1A5|nr:uncharacterized protein LOC119075888 [Bradysia coprophila]